MKIFNYILIGLIFIWLTVLTLNMFSNEKDTYVRDIGQLEAMQKSIDSINAQQKVMMNNLLEHQISINAIGEDYPPKKRLKDREWCLELSCLTKGKE